jgi:aldehyde dehydrogenase (NAD+)|tara:strand:- start:4746 stop:6107 length:1362 start_codon:yes stop_codon:yes gene_type:complete
MEKLINSQREFFFSKATLDLNFRIEQLRKLEGILKKNETELDRAIYADFGKSSFENYETELGLIYHDIDSACRNLKRWAKVKKVYTNVANLPGRSYIIPEPLGVSLVIGAWNYPYQLSLCPTIAAIAAGNTVVLKPSELSAETSRIISKLINENFESNFFKVVEGGIEETTNLLAQKFDKIFFTGSTTVGKIVYRAAAKNLTPVTLELGGKSPAILDEKCNLKTSAKRLVWAKFINSGQTCIAPDYVFVHKSIKEQFLKQVSIEIKKSKYAVENSNYVQIINKRNMERLINFIDKDKVYLGGDFDMENKYISPTVMVDVDFDDAVMQEEIFGPIMPVLEYENIEDVILKIKEKPKPLACYVFTNSKKNKWKILNEISFGGGAVNDAVMHISNSRLPFGGVGDSGTGSYHGEFGFKTFSHFKSVLEKPTWIEPNLKYYPLTDLKLKLIKFVLKL